MDTNGSAGTPQQQKEKVTNGMPSAHRMPKAFSRINTTINYAT